MELFDQSWKKLDRKAGSHIEQEEYASAVDVFMEMDRACPDTTYPSLKIGRCLIELERYDEARECFKRCLEIDPDHPTAQFFIDSIEGK